MSKIVTMIWASLGELSACVPDGNLFGEVFSKKRFPLEGASRTGTLWPCRAYSSAACLRLLMVSAILGGSYIEKCLICKLHNVTFAKEHCFSVQNIYSFKGD